MISSVGSSHGWQGAVFRRFVESLNLYCLLRAHLFEALKPMGKSKIFRDIPLAIGLY